MNGTGQQTDEVDQSPDAAADAGAQGQNDLQDTILAVAQVEIVDTDTAQEEAQQSCNQLGLLLAVNNGCSRGLSVAAGSADSCAGSYGVAAVMAEVVAIAQLIAASSA